jgi:hypothetical protein
MQDEGGMGGRRASGTAATLSQRCSGMSWRGASHRHALAYRTATLNSNLGSHGGVRTACGRDEQATLRRSRPFEMYDTK